MPQFRFPISGCMDDSSKAVTVRRFQNVDELPVLTFCHPTTWPFVLVEDGLSGTTEERGHDFSEGGWEGKGHGE